LQKASLDESCGSVMSHNVNGLPLLGLVPGAIAQSGTELRFNKNPDVQILVSRTREHVMSMGRNSTAPKSLSMYQP